MFHCSMDHDKGFFILIIIYLELSHESVRRQNVLMKKGKGWKHLVKAYG